MLSQTFLIVLSASLALCQAQSHENLTISTKTGAYIGFINGTTPNVRQFLNIPYAQPPTGLLRWEPPASPLTNSSSLIDSTTFPPSCAQYLSANPSVYNQDVPEFLIDPAPYPAAAGTTPPSTSESCLSLAIWTPLDTPKSLPVILFMTGGGYVNGGIDIPYQLPHNWVQRTQSHIVVTINYRLGIFGFPGSASLPSQNLAILDQRQALQWVYDNIASFGGDPTRITLWGQSAGAACTDAHNFAFYKNPLVTGLVLSSGTTNILDGRPIPSTSDAHNNFTFVAHSIGCRNLSLSDEIACMRSQPASRILNFIGQYNDNNNGSLPTLSFGPIADEEIIFSNYTSRYSQGLFSYLPAIIGTTANEAAGYPYPINNRTAGPYQPFSDATTAALFLCPSHDTSELREKAGAKTFRYQYAGNFTNISPRPWLGAYHDTDLPMLFGTYADFRSNLMTKEELQKEKAVSETMQDFVLAFMQDPKGGLEGKGWPEYGQGQMIRFGGSDGRVSGVVDVGDVDGVCYGEGPYDSSP
ncbi:hypothetical protein LTS08_008842 [Lithohypha guttulata]|nr:hypothetical protein LTS08_008842 [Lithohypha guttulata]